MSGSRTDARASSRGFSLFELLVVVAIIGILAAIALPSYRSYVERTHRTVAKVALHDLLSRQESYATDHKRYAVSFERLGLTGSASDAYVTADGVISRNSANALYKITLQGTDNTKNATCAASGSAASTGFRLDAVPASAAAADSRCGTICIDSTGVRGSSKGSAAVAECWGR